MIAAHLIAEAAAITGLAVALVAFVRGWPPGRAIVAALGAAIGIAGWRALANVLALNTDFLPAVSVGDSGCALAGSLVPLLVGRTARADSRFDALPAIVGGLVGFVVNVVIL